MPKVLRELVVLNSAAVADLLVSAETDCLLKTACRGPLLADSEVSHTRHV